MIVIKCFLLLLVFSIPLFVGFIFHKKTWIETYLFGQVSLWAIFQIMAVPMIHLRLSFDTLWISYTVVMAGLAVWGFTQKKKPAISFSQPWTHYIPLILAGIVILGQMGVYVFGMHLDEDDARWLAEANDALVKNKMYLHNPATGDYIGRFVGEMTKDVFSPWGMYIAVLSKLTFVRTAVIAHTVYAPILLLISYFVYYLMGKELFKGKTEQGLFLLCVSVIQMFFAGNAYTQSVFALTRIWQGKAVVAAIMIPLFLLLLLRVEKEDTRANWLWFAVAGCASCLFSGMGIIISLILIAVFGFYAIICKRFKRILYLLLALLPSLVFGLLYYQMKG